MEKNHIGEKIRLHRERLEMSVQQLAEESRCPEELITQLECGELIPSLTPLLNIARALGVRLGTFLDDAVTTEPVVHRACSSGSAEEKIMHFSGTHAMNSTADSSHSALDFLPLAADKTDRHMEPFIITVKWVKTEHPQSSHEGEEFLYVMEGQLEVTYGSDLVYTLMPGDSIYYDSFIPHNVHASGGADAKILAVVYTPF